ncbi:MAG TPA: cellulose biosynthesis cyclic di-GMP-binding regulatory protein BcsB, partial [Bauldia sp.]|nr:cellulose biosynthesis cyclic di-GMP-binding regulatory protein BcsB [Bauldia sp.]
MIPSRRIASLLAAALLAPAIAAAQAPFDMSPERGELPPAAAPGTQPQAPPAPRAPAGPPGFRPFDIGGESAPAGTDPVSPIPADSVTPNDLTSGEPSESGKDAAPDLDVAEPQRAVIDRYLLSSAQLRFEGEMGRRSWGFWLTAEQAERQATLTIAFNSAIYVSPEDSELRITLNDRLVVDQPLAARENPTHLDTPIPPGTLRPGSNVISFEVSQRHRTDCAIPSTYDLWTEFEADGTGLIFEDSNPTALGGLDDLPAVGLDPIGRTRIHLIAPGGERAYAESDLARLVQAIVLRGNFRQAVVSVDDGLYKGPPAGVLSLAVGTVGELAAVIPGLPPEANSAPTVGFLDTPGAAPTLVVSGPAWPDVKAAIGYVADGVGRPLDVDRTTIDTTPVLLPLVPMIEGERRLTLSELGVPTQEFNGRRFRSDFYIGLPGDFFSGAYGEATIYLDAAYTGEVRPGSHIDVYANGFIAANVPLTSDDGDILQSLPIKVAMTHFRPGVNVISVEAVLDTEADAICAPGTVAGGPDRFVLFDTSEFFMPAFGRIERWPDLAALVGTGLPYADSETPVPLVLGRASAETYSAALTFLS